VEATISVVPSLSHFQLCDSIGRPSHSSSYAPVAVPPLPPSSPPRPSDVDGDTFDLAEGCGMCSPNKPLDQLKQFFPTVAEELRLQIEALDADLLEAFKDVYSDTHADNVLLFFKAFDPDRVLPELAEVPDPGSASTPGEEGQYVRDANNDPLKYLGCAMFQRDATVLDILKTVSRLIHEYYNAPSDYQGEAMITPVVPDRWERNLVYTIWRSLTDCYSELTANEESLSSPFFPHMAKTVSTVFGI
jgi:hypothetical protein